MQHMLQNAGDSFILQHMLQTWLVLSLQLPAAPSSARVAAWRRLKLAGAAGLTNGTWVLPHTLEHQRVFSEVGSSVRAQGGQAFLFAAETLSSDEDTSVRTRFVDDRAREYDELAEQTRAFLDEMKRETALEKFTFAELEEVEEDFQKLESWLGKVRHRDFFAGDRLQKAAAEIERCRAALAQFAAEVYAREGVTGGADD
jgi:hypothetical protein